MEKLIETDLMLGYKKSLEIWGVKKEAIEKMTNEQIKDEYKRLSAIKNAERKKQLQEQEQKQKHEHKVKQEVKYDDIFIIKKEFDWAFYGLKKRQQEAEFSNYVIYNDKQKEAFEFIKTHKDNNYIFYGNSGTGKGHLAISLLKEKVKENKSCKYINALDLFILLKDWDNLFEIKEEFSTYDFLIIDEIGKTFKSEFEQNLLFNILNNRYDDYLQTILITNMGYDDFSALVTKPVLDRLLETYTLIHFSWDSFRSQNKNKKSKKQEA
jgi:DNA replication protein DnaC